MVLRQKLWDFSAAALVFYLPGMCTHTETEGEQRKARDRYILKSSEKNTIFNEHPVAQHLAFYGARVYISPLLIIQEVYK